MSVKNATVTTIAALITFILIAMGIGSVGARDNQYVSEDGYGISSTIGE
ncbi:hypothetical protein [Bartonella tamiae]|uniref:Uncharacterized protein n=1 Tax=Bartonella tamiae Th239 TaxID=1094558 RepID=J1JXM2_9HYPH|nr:hypothetical protein [Bartonella tamiae]EJF89380.1 hypothetical protein ME5_01931 [Bartonella tamiae Th239]EJF92755.1 hypothetical protein MEG_01925 [Bartonella tamiae Th307]